MSEEKRPQKREEGERKPRVEVVRVSGTGGAVEGGAARGPIRVEPGMSEQVEVRPDETARGPLHLPDAAETTPTGPIRVTSSGSGPVVIRPTPLKIVTVAAPSSQRIIIRKHELQAPQHRVRITLEDVVAATAILNPQDQSQVGQAAIAVRGTAQPKSKLGLRTTVPDEAPDPRRDGFRAELRVAYDGTFAFPDVELANGWNTILVESVTYPTVQRCRTFSRVWRRERPHLYVGIRDLYSRETMKEGDDVVRCRQCRAFSKRQSWHDVPGCALCALGGGYHEFWGPNDDEFYQPRQGAV